MRKTADDSSSQTARRNKKKAAGPAVGSVTKRPINQFPLVVTNPRNAGQRAVLKALLAHDLTLALGPAGTGKTHMAINRAMDAFAAGQVERIILARPAVEAGEKLGFLPGGVSQKLDPYLRPLFDIIIEKFDTTRYNAMSVMKALIADGSIEITAVGHLRGRTLKNSFIVIDEAQNCTFTQLKMIVTRLGEGSTMVLTGDPQQSDLPAGLSGLSQLRNRVRGLKKVGLVELSAAHVVRHPLLTSLLPHLDDNYMSEDHSG